MARLIRGITLGLLLSSIQTAYLSTCSFFNGDAGICCNRLFFEPFDGSVQVMVELLGIEKFGRRIRNAHVIDNHIGFLVFFGSFEKEDPAPRHIAKRRATGSYNVFFAECFISDKPFLDTGKRMDG